MSTKRDAIEASARDLFFAHGTKRVTVEEICRTAGASKGTFYKYFDDKQDLVRVILDKLVDEGFRAFDDILALDIAYPEKIERMTRWRADFFEPMDPSFIEDAFASGEVQAEYKSRFLANVKATQDKGELRAGISGELVWLVSEKLGELAADGSWKHVTSDYGDYQEQIRTLFYHGLLSTGRGEEAE